MLNTTNFVNLEPMHIKHQFIFNELANNFNLYTVESFTNLTTDFNNLLNKSEDQENNFKDFLRSCKVVKYEDDIFICSNSKAEETFQKSLVEGAVGDDLEKGLIYEQISYSHNVEISKTGKEIKEKSEILMESLEAKLSRAKMVIESCYVDCCADDTSEKPNSNIPDWWTGDIIKNELVESLEGMKIFDYGLLYDKDNRSEVSLNSSFSIQDQNAPEPIYELRRKYNDAVEKYYNILVDCKMLSFFSRNLKEKENYKLSAKLALTLGF